MIRLVLINIHGFMDVLFAALECLQREEYTISISISISISIQENNILWPCCAECTK